jgi:GT2 family glycosyltransferase
MDHVVISTISYNNAQATHACLSSLAELSHPNFTFEVVVIDNASREVFTLTKDEKNALQIEVIRSEKNLGFAGGHNLGIACAKEKNTDYVLILNNDTLVDASLLAELVKVAREHSKAGAVVPKIYFQKGHEFHKDRYEKKDLGNVLWYAGGEMDWANIIGHHRGVDAVDSGLFDTTEQIDLLTGCCVLFPMAVLGSVGGFDERYFLYYEDADLNERLKQKGYEVWYAPKATLVHANAGSTGGSGSTLQDYFISRNRMLFGLRYAPLRSKVALMKESVRLLGVGRQWQKIGIRDYYARRFGKGSFPV